MSSLPTGYVHNHFYHDTTPEFTLKHLMYAVNEINLGNTKSSCVVPPLISHLFLAALRILTEPDDELDGK